MRKLEYELSIGDLHLASEIPVLCKNVCHEDTVRF